MPGFVHHERVRFGDLDAMRHLNNVVYLRYYETARISYLHALAAGNEPFTDGGFGLIFAECHINYRAPVHFGEELAVRCSIADVRRSSFHVPFEMRVGERLRAEATACWSASTTRLSARRRCRPSWSRRSKARPPAPRPDGVASRPG